MEYGNIEKGEKAGGEDFAITIAIKK